jgi:DHA2 family multidrug resistance protein-like MFS transporter
LELECTERTIEGAPVDASSEPEGLPRPRRYFAIAALSIGTVVASIDNGGVTIALPTIARNFAVAPSAVVLIVTVYQLLLIMAVLPLSALGDRIGHRTLYQAGQLLFLVATPFCFFAHSLPALVLIRACQALGAAATFSVSSALVRSIFPKARLGSGMAVNTVIATIASALAPSIGGLILSNARWPWVIAASAPFAVISLLIGRKALPDPHGHDEPYDVAAAAMCAAMFGLTVAGLQGFVQGATVGVSSALIAAGTIVGVIFVRREMSQLRPVLPVDLLRKRRFALSSLASLAASIGMIMVTLTLPFRLQHEFGYSPAETGLAMAAWPLAMMFLAPTSGLLSDRLPAGLLPSIGMALATAGMISLGFLPVAPQHFDLVWRLLLAAAGFGIFLSPNARQIILAAPLNRAAAAGGLTQTTRLTGQVLGSTGAAALLALGIGMGRVPPLAAAGLTAIAGLCSLVLLTGEQGAADAAETGFV